MKQTPLQVKVPDYYLQHGQPKCSGSPVWRALHKNVPPFPNRCTLALGPTSPPNMKLIDRRCTRWFGTAPYLNMEEKVHFFLKFQLSDFTMELQLMETHLLSQEKKHAKVRTKAIQTSKHCGTLLKTKQNWCEAADSNWSTSQCRQSVMFTISLFKSMLLWFK